MNTRTMLAGVLTLGCGATLSAQIPNGVPVGTGFGVNERIFQPNTLVAAQCRDEADELPAVKPAPAPVAVANQATDLLCNPCPPCGPAGRCWISAELIYWIASGNPTPPLITAAPNGNPVTQAGRLGDPGTRVLAGGRRHNNDFRAGFRVNAGMWLNDSQTCGLEADYLYLGQSRDSIRAGGNGSTIVSRPFFNVVTNQPDTELVAFPGILSGFVSVDAKSDVTGGGFNFVKNHSCTPCSRLDFLVGYRYLNVRDEIVIREDLTSLPGRAGVPAGTRFLIEDRFRTENNFHGGVVGVAGEQRFGRCYLGYRSSVAIGVNHQVTEISGFTVINAPPPASAINGRFPGGLLAQLSNMGRYTNDEFAVLPEVGLRLGCQFTPHVRGYVGYNFLYLSNVQRAGDAINLRVNPTQLAPMNVLVGPREPTFLQTTTDFWAQGIAMGFEGRY